MVSIRSFYNVTTLTNNNHMRLLIRTPDWGFQGFTSVSQGTSKVLAVLPSPFLSSAVLNEGRYRSDKRQVHPCLWLSTKTKLFFFLMKRLGSCSLYKTIGNSHQICECTFFWFSILSINASLLKCLEENAIIPLSQLVELQRIPKDGMIWYILQKILPKHKHHIWQIDVNISFRNSLSSHW